MFRISTSHSASVQDNSGLLAACAFAAAALFGAAQAHAAQTPVSELSTGEAEELCEILDHQYQFTMKFKADLPYADEAEALHAAGVEKCENGNPAQGVADLRESLEIMHVVPSDI